MVEGVEGGRVAGELEELLRGEDEYQDVPEVELELTCDLIDRIDICLRDL